MMDDLISRQAALDVLNKLARNSFSLKPTFQIYLDALKDADLKIRQVPTAEPRRGKWKEVQVVIGRDGCFTTKEYECELCGYQEFRPENFCARCGARMEESE